MRFISWYVELSSAVERIRALQEMLQKKEETLEAMQAEVERLTIVSSRTFHTLQQTPAGSVGRGGGEGKN
jgi:hypothetical protein